MHPELVYVVVRSSWHPDLFIIAKDRLSALEYIFGSHNEVEILAQLPGRELVGLAYRSIFTSPSSADVPLNSDCSHARILRVIGAPHVTPDTGTGLVHCAPAHGAEDYQAFRSQSLLDSGMLCHVNSEGKFTEGVRDIVGPFITNDEDLVGLDVLESGSRAMFKLLDRVGALLATEKIRHRYPYDWRTDKPVIVTCV